MGLQTKQEQIQDFLAKYEGAMAENRSLTERLREMEERLATLTEDAEDDMDLDECPDRTHNPTLHDLMNLVQKHEHRMMVVTRYFDSLKERGIGAWDMDLIEMGLEGCHQTAQSIESMTLKVLETEAKIERLAKEAAGRIIEETH